MNKRPRLHLLLLTLAALLALGFAKLGHWQYLRGVQKATFLADWTAALAQPVRPLGAAQLAEPVQRPLLARLSLRPLQPFRWLLLDNQRRGAQVGVGVYGLFEPAPPAADGRALLVEWDWLPLPATRALPQPAAPPPELQLDGLLLPWPGQGILLAANPWRPGQDAVLLTALIPEEIEQASGRPLLHGVFKPAPDPSALAALREAALPNTLPPEQHYGYALQWSGLALTVIIVALLLWRRSRPS